MTNFVVYGPLRGKGRPKFVRAGTHVHAYTPETTRAYEEQIRAAFLLAHGERIDGPVALDMTAYQALPKKANKAAKQAAEQGSIKPLGKPDIDNIIKIVMDALNGCAYTDDTQVVQLEARKEYAADGENRLEITVQEAKAHGD